MKNVIEFYLAELIKLRRTFAFWLTIIGAAIIPLTMIITYVYNWKMFVPATGVNPWDELFGRAFNGVILFMPLYIILLIGLIFNIEYKANAWKHIFVQPISKESIFSAKYLIVFSLIVLFMVLFSVFTFLVGEIVGVYKVELGFNNNSADFKYIFNFSIKVLIAILATTAIHFWLGLNIRNLVSVLGIGLAGIALAILMNGKGGYADFFPYAYPIMLLNYVPSSPDVYLERFHLISIVYFVLFFFLAFFQFKRSFKG
ncbi:ABC transporter permease [Dyadobacter sp. OTU695]|uniref:ABC transporter permease n=1 Tax=Dyadobacter sp. OTU695 TaxID=3043860 RepID=UPI00313AAC6C